MKCLLKIYLQMVESIASNGMQSCQLVASWNIQISQELVEWEETTLATMAMNEVRTKKKKKPGDK